MTILFGFFVMSLDVAHFKFVYLKNDQTHRVQESTSLVNA
jgi:hypothetical protein